MSPDFTVHEFGTDPNGRTIFMTQYMHDWWESVCEQLGHTPQIVQGAFMTRNPGGGAKASGGAHDEGGCLDIRTRDLTKKQIDELVLTIRLNGAAAWRRDKTARHGNMDPHCHLTLGTDEPLSEKAQESWTSYLNDGDGLKGPLSDYEHRPDPLITEPPEELPMTPEQMDQLAELTAKKTVEKLLATTVASDTVPQRKRKVSGMLTSIERLAAKAARGQG